MSNPHVEAEVPALEFVLENPHDFARRLEDYTHPPEQRREQFLRWSEQELRTEARSVTELLRRFAEVVASNTSGQTVLNDFLTRLDLRIISRDHDWRAIFAVIRNHQAPNWDALRRTTVDKYVQYLISRKRLVDYIYASRSALAKTSQLAPVQPLEYGPMAAEMELQEEMPGLSRLPVAEPVSLNLEDGELLEMEMGHHRFELVGGPRPYLLSETGLSGSIRNGRNMIGRHPECDLIIDGSFSEVSRVHLILDWEGRTSFTLIDLSSRGTWLKD